MSSLVENATIKIRRDSAANWTSNNPTPASGEWCIETDTGQVKIGDGSTAWNAKGYHIKNPESFDISASNKVYNLPAVKGGQKEIIKWSGGDGTYKLTFTTQGSDTIGGLAPSVWEGEGEGLIVLSDDGGTDWAVEKYIDYGSIADSGTETGREYTKTENEIVISGKSSFTGVSLTVSDEGMFRNTPGSVTFNYGKSFSSIPKIMAPYGNSVSLVSVNRVSSGETVALGSVIIWTGVSTASASPVVEWEAVGPWK